jgi:hypothetical protein
MMLFNIYSISLFISLLVISIVLPALFPVAIILLGFIILTNCIAIIYMIIRWIKNG